MQDLVRLTAALLMSLSAAGAVAQDEGGGDLRAATQNQISFVSTLAFASIVDNAAPRRHADAFDLHPIDRVAAGEQKLAIAPAG